MQLQIDAPGIKTVYEQQLFNGKDFHVFICDKTENINGLYQHNCYGSTLVLTGRYCQEINDKHILLERGDSVFIPLGPYHQSFYDFGATKILNVGVSRRFLEQHYRPPLPFCFVALQVYRANNSFPTYIETIIASFSFRGSGLDEFVEVVTLYIINRLRHHREEQVLDDIPQWLKTTAETIHDKRQFNENAPENMIHLPAKPQECLIRATQCYYSKTPMQIIDGIRVSFVKKQLEMTNYSVTSIVYEPDYSSPSLSTKTFKKLTSFTSDSYRKKLAEFDQ